MTDAKNEADSGASHSDAELGRPMPDLEWGLCDPKCPNLAQWEHPFWHHTAWCWHLMRDLDWYDYWQARCINSQPDAQMLKIRDCGRTMPPNSVDPLPVRIIAYGSFTGNLFDRICDWEMSDGTVRALSMREVNALRTNAYDKSDL